MIKLLRWFLSGRQIAKDQASRIYALEEWVRRNAQTLKVSTVPLAPSSRACNRKHVDET